MFLQFVDLYSQKNWIHRKEKLYSAAEHEFDLNLSWISTWPLSGPIFSSLEQTLFKAPLKMD